MAEKDFDKTGAPAAKTHKVGSAMAYPVDVGASSVSSGLVASLRDQAWTTWTWA